jgi:hypothetical protein
MDEMYATQARDKCLATVNTVMDLDYLQYAGSIWIRGGTVSFS